MLLDFPDTIFGNCAPHKLPFSQIITNNITLLINKIIQIILLSLLFIYIVKRYNIY